MGDIFRCTEKQKQLMIDFMEQYIDLSFNTVLDGEEELSLWKTLKNQLNCHTQTKRTVAVWKKSWSNMKKSAEQRFNLLNSGIRDMPRSDTDMRIIQLLNLKSTAKINDDYEPPTKFKKVHAETVNVPGRGLTVSSVQDFRHNHVIPSSKSCTFTTLITSTYIPSSNFTLCTNKTLKNVSPSMNMSFDTPNPFQTRSPASLPTTDSIQSRSTVESEKSIKINKTSETIIEKINTAIIKEFEMQNLKIEEEFAKMRNALLNNTFEEAARDLNIYHDLSEVKQIFLENEEAQGIYYDSQYLENLKNSIIDNADDGNKYEFLE